MSKKPGGGAKPRADKALNGGGCAMVAAVEVAVLALVAKAVWHAAVQATTRTGETR